MAQFDFKKYCTPAQVYLVLAVIGLISGFLRNFRVLTLIFNTIFVVLFAWILNFLCSKGLTAISWVLVLLPFVLLASTFFLAMDAADHKDHETVVILEGIDHEGEEKEEAPSMEVLADEEKLKEWCSTRPDSIYCSE